MFYIFGSVYFQEIHQIHRPLKFLNPAYGNQLLRPQTTTNRRKNLRLLYCRQRYALRPFLIHTQLVNQSCCSHFRDNGHTKLYKSDLLSCSHTIVHSHSCNCMQEIKFFNSFSGAGAWQVRTGCRFPFLNCEPHCVGGRSTPNHCCTW